MQASKGEIKIHEILEMNDVIFTEEYSFEGLTSTNGRLLAFDFAIFDDDGNLDYLIEYQGKQHYEPVSKFGGKRGLFQHLHNDNLKRRFCMRHNIKLIEIPYTEYNLISYDYIMRKAGYCY